MSETRRGFGVAGALPLALVGRLAAAAEAAGYRTFWVNDTPGGDGLRALREAATAAPTIRLGVGVIPLDRQPPEVIAATIAELRLPEDRLTVGVGSGQAEGGLARVRSGVPSLRALTSATVVVGALGPRMCRVAGEIGDGALLNWLTPGYVGPSIEVVRAAAREAGRPLPRVDAYVRTALGDGAIARLREEGERYASFPAYGAHFGRMGADPMATAVIGGAPGTIAAGLASFSGALDETVVRAITAEESVDAYLALLWAAAPGR